MSWEKVLINVGFSILACRISCNRRVLGLPWHRHGLWLLSGTSSICHIICPWSLRPHPNGKYHKGKAIPNKWDKGIGVCLVYEVFVIYSRKLGWQNGLWEWQGLWDSLHPMYSWPIGNEERLSSWWACFTSFYSVYLIGFFVASFFIPSIKHGHR